MYFILNYLQKLIFYLPFWQGLKKVYINVKSEVIFYHFVNPPPVFDVRIIINCIFLL